MGIRLTPRLQLRWEPGENDDIPVDLSPFAHTFEVDWREALFTLAAEKIEAQGSPVVRFWRQWELTSGNLNLQNRVREALQALRERAP